MPKHSTVTAPSKAGFARSLSSKSFDANHPPFTPLVSELSGRQPPQRKRLYAVRVFYAVFFGLGALAFAFQSTRLDAVDWALISFCMVASVLSFVLSTRPKV